MLHYKYWDELNPYQNPFTDSRRTQFGAIATDDLGVVNLSVKQRHVTERVFRHVSIQLKERLIQNKYNG